MIQTMQQTHVDAVLRLQKQWEMEEITYGVVAPTREQMIESLSPFNLVAIDNEEVIGFLIADMKEKSELCVFPSGASYLEIEDLYIRKDYRSKGIGEMLLRHCEELARKMCGTGCFLVSSATKNAEKIRRFYEKNDYQIWTTVFFKRVGEQKD
jgi:ribosomal protein S18 acetylase RimI-like enzyme